ncbi:MAG: tetratricopeptide repeat protein [Pyrinomonadaceae bacterium]
MRVSAVLFLMLAFSLTAFSQPPNNPKVKKIRPAVSKTLNEKEELEKAFNEPDALARIAALQKFIADFPKSKELVLAQERIVSARAQLGEENLKTGDTAKGIEFFKSAVTDAPVPMPEKLFTEVIIQFPTNLFFRGERDAAFEIAKMIEEKAGNDAKQILGLATFYIAVENATNARRLAQRAIELAPELPAAYHTLGITNRLGFRLDEAVAAYSKALELDPNLIVSKRSLAEMKRANGKPEEAVTLYREILAKDAADATAKTGLILALFESGKQTEAEPEMQKSLAVNPNDLPLLVGAAYFYAAHNNGVKAVELAGKALTIEPRYTWANIALARGYMAQKRPLDAEKVLLAARNYGNFPTLDYEIASARIQAGFYREAADELKKNFEVKDGVLSTYLGNRVGVDAEDFLKLLSLERRAAIFSYEAAETVEDAERLKSLLEFSQELNNENANETVLSETADNFVKGDDKMKIHRQLFVAGRLLDKKKNLPKVIELTQAAVKGVDTALDVPNPSAAVMADELYETRTLAISRGEVLLVPEIPRQTLSVILRGRIEELSGWTLYQQDRPVDAVVKLKRAVSVLPEDSSWWRSSVWRLGVALEADGKTKEALENYIKSYKSGEASPARYLIIETLYQKLNGNSEGLENKIGKRPESISDTVAKVAEIKEVNNEIQSSPSPEAVKEISPAFQTAENPPTQSLQTEKVMPPEIKPTPKPAENQAVETTNTITEIPTETEIIPENTTNDEITTTPETLPTPSPEIITEPTLKATPPETNQMQITGEKPKGFETAAKTKTTLKPLFEPVIINIRKKEESKSKTTGNSPKTETADEKKSAQQETQTKESIQPKSVENGNIESKKPQTVTTRPRVFINGNLATGETLKCAMVVSQESIWLVSGGGSLGILVGFTGQGSAGRINAVSSSPKDIEVLLEPEIGTDSGRAFFILKSISSKKGAFTVTFNSPCGEKEVQVRVR